MPTLQSYTINGQIIEKARWNVKTLENINLNDIIHISFKSIDKELLKWVSSLKNKEISVEREDKDSYSIILSFRIAKLKHMLENGMKEIDSMAQIIPINRDIELSLIYLLDPEKSDPRFIAVIKKTDKPV